MAEIHLDERTSSVIGVLTPIEFSIIKQVVDAEGTTRLVQLFASFISQNALVQRERAIAKVKDFVESASDEKLAAMLEVATSRR